MIGTLVDAYEGWKLWLVPPNEDLRALVHLHGGLALWLVLVLIWRRGMSAFAPLAVVIALCLLGEAADLYRPWPHIRDWMWRDMAGDIFNTLFWPLVLWLYASWRDGRMARATDAGGETDGDGGAETPPR